MIENSHPWADFLKARYYAILWMRDKMGCDDKTIADKLSMDETQVYFIRNEPPSWKIHDT